MKIVVIGGSGLIGRKLVTHLREHGVVAVAASPSTGVNTVTGEGLAAALSGAQTVVDVSNAPVFDDAGVLHFFETSTQHLLEAEAAAGVRHHVLLSIAGADRLPDSGYMRAKVTQEAMVRAGKLPYTLLRSAQFFEFLGAIADAGTIDGVVHLAPVLVQPAAADDVAAALAAVALSPAANGIQEFGGPEKFRLDRLVARLLDATGDPRPVLPDEEARYFGAKLAQASLLPGPNAGLGPTTFAHWLETRSSAVRQ